MDRSENIKAIEPKVESLPLQWLAYFDIFNHPLREDELSELCCNLLPQDQLNASLHHWVQTGVCFKQKDYFGLNPGLSESIAMRHSKETEARKYFNRLPFFARLISHFPYVKALAVSGSLSKNVIHEDGDIDYFVITQENRLWICRALLILFKKVFLLNSKKYFCVNYFVDEKNLTITDKNIYTAVEIAYLLPVYNGELIQRMKQQNEWTNSYLPGFKNPINFKEVKPKIRPSKVFEWMLDWPIGDYLDFYLMKTFHKHWSRKFKHFSADKLELTMRSNRGVSKHHPQDFQQKVLSLYSKNLQALNIES